MVLPSDPRESAKRVDGDVKKPFNADCLAVGGGKGPAGFNLSSFFLSASAEYSANAEC